MSARYVTLGNGCQVGIGAYANAWRAVNAAPDGQEYAHGLCGSWTVTADDVRREYADGLHDRINRHVAGYGAGRKWDADWQRDAGHAARRINSRCCLRSRELPLWLRARMAHRTDDEA